MLAICSHNVLVSNYVPFFDFDVKSIEGLDDVLCRLGGQFVHGSKRAQLFWVVTSQKVMIEMDDGTTYVTQVRPAVFLCGYHGTPLTETYCATYDDLFTFDSWMTETGVDYIAGYSCLAIPSSNGMFEVRFDEQLKTGERDIGAQMFLEFGESLYAGNVASEEGL